MATCDCAARYTEPHLYQTSGGEGYTNFAWMLYMAVFHLLRVPPRVISLCVQATGALCLVANLVFVRQIALDISGSSGRVAVAALVLTAFYIPLDNWALQGTEVSVLTLATTVSAVVIDLMALSPFKPFQRLLLIERPLENMSDQANVRAALDLRAHTSDDAVVAVTWAGAVPYFSERPSIDLLGKMDPHIAHEPMHRRPGPNWTTFYPGHLKWDYRYAIDDLKPDVIQAPLWRLSYELDTPDDYLKNAYDLRELGTSQWYVRRGTVRVR